MKKRDLYIRHVTTRTRTSLFWLLVTYPTGAERSVWSNCTVTCGGGVQTRDLMGQVQEIRECNTQDCAGICINSAVLL